VADRKFFLVLNDVTLLRKCAYTSISIFVSWTFVPYHYLFVFHQWPWLLFAFNDITSSFFLL